MATTREIRLTVNGVAHEGVVEPRMTLADCNTVSCRPSREAISISRPVRTPLSISSSRDS